MAPTYIFGSSVSGQAGVLNSTTYAPTHTPQNLSTTGAHMNAGMYTEYVVTLAREQLVHANPAWQEQMTITGGNKPVATYFKFSELNFNDGSLLENNPDTFKLAEGVTPSHNLKMTVTQDTITPQQYGLVTYYTDIIDQVSFIKFSTKLMERMAWGIARIIDEQTRLHLNTNLSLYDFSATPDGIGVMSIDRLTRLRAALERQNIVPVRSEGNNYPLILHPDQVADLRKDASFKAALEASGRLIGDRQAPPHTDYIGSFAGFSFYKTTKCTVYENPPGTKVGYTNFTIGADCIAATSFSAPDVGAMPSLGGVYGQGGSDAYRGGNNMTAPVQLIEKPLGSSGVFDPLNQLQSVGAKWTFGLKLINPSHGWKARFTSNMMV